jgi:tetrahydromethanopterin S-methyltransferase subunit D
LELTLEEEKIMDINLMVTVLILIAVGGVLIALGVFFIPVGGAPAAMSTATGVATGCEMIVVGAGATGLFTAATLYNQFLLLVIVTAGVSSAIMMGVTMLVLNLIVVYGVGAPPSFARKEYDPVTKEHVKPYVTPGTVGHGIPTATYLGGQFGAFLAGLGGALTFSVMYRFTCGVGMGEMLGVLAQTSPNVAAIALSAITAVGAYLINANITAYSIRGVIESWIDPKFEAVPRTLAACFSASLLFGILIVLASMTV